MLRGKSLSPHFQRSRGVVDVFFAQWHTIVSGDTCSVIGSEYGVSIEQLRKWNPQLKADCSNLLRDDAYCVKGDDVPTSTSSSYVTPPAATPSGTTSNCYKVRISVVEFFENHQSADSCLKSGTSSSPAITAIRSKPTTASPWPSSKSGTHSSTTTARTCC